MTSLKVDGIPYHRTQPGNEFETMTARGSNAIEDDNLETEITIVIIIYRPAVSDSKCDEIIKD